MFSKNLFFALPLTLAVTGLGSAAVTTPFADDFGGGLVNWETAGDVSVQNSSAVLTTAYHADQDDAPLPSGALNLSGNATVNAGGDLEDFSGITVGALDLDSLSQATEGSAMKITFSVTAGDRLSFDWQLLSRDSTAGLDYAYVTINGALIQLASASAATAAASGDYFTQTPVTSFNYVFSTSGDYTVSIGIVDVGDYAGTSALRVDNVVVPEASASVLAAAGMAAVVLRRRRK